MSSTLPDTDGPVAGSIPYTVLSNDVFTEKYGDVVSQQMLKMQPLSSTFSIKDEVTFAAGKFGLCWRFVFYKILTQFSDPVNALRISRPLQLEIDYLEPHEAFVLGTVIEALDSVVTGEQNAKEKLHQALVQALKIRNVGRVLVQTARGPFNVLWHLYFQLSNIRSFQFAGQIPLSRISFPPPSENFIGTKQHVVNSILRRLLGPGRWLTRIATGGREEFIVDDENATSQNLAAESTGFEEAMRQQYGNYFGRQRIGNYRTENRLPTDESVIRTFFTQPAPTLINNGVVHVLRVVANHWKSTLNNPYGNFGNQRMEMLDVAITLRFHMPVVLLTLANFRGLDFWDSDTLGPLVKDLMNYKVGEDMQRSSSDLIGRLEDAADNVCGGVMSRVGPFKDWIKQIKLGAELLNAEKTKVRSIVDPVITGIEAGYHLIQSVNWESPSDDVIEISILNHIKLDKAKKIVQSVQNEYDTARREYDQRIEAAQNDKKGRMKTREAYNKRIEKLLKVKESDRLDLLNLNEIEVIVEQAKNNRLGLLTLNEIELIVVGLVEKKEKEDVEVHEKLNELKLKIKELQGTNSFSLPMMDVIASMPTSSTVNLSSIHKELVGRIHTVVKKDIIERRENGMTSDMCGRALEFVTPRDKRTLIEMVINGLENERPAKLLLKRTKTLLEREFRRQKLDHQIEKVSENIPFAESIVRAQRAFMIIELDCIRKFSYNAFMEFEDLRSYLAKLQVVSQIQCRRLDSARLKRLVDIRDNCPARVTPNDMAIGMEYFVETTYQKFKCIKYDGNNIDANDKKVFKGPPQNTLVIGGGPSGLLTSLHCLENCLTTGGGMKLYESRDAFEKAGGTYERAQVVRLDSRWVRMLRYHLGTSFEDVWIPASGETDAHLGNTLPEQGFIEITIKDLESVLHVEISKLWSLNLIHLYSGSNALFDYKENKITKLGNALKVDDLVKLQIGEDGNSSNNYHTWRVAELELYPSLEHKDLKLDETYYIFDRQLFAGVKSCRLTGINRHDESNPKYTFSDTKKNTQKVVDARSFPRVYASRCFKTKSVMFESVDNKDRKHVFDFNDIENDTFVMDVGQSNIVFATGKPATYGDHFKLTQEEPYGVCCIQGLKISLNMHNFGEKRWGDGIVDDIRSQTEQNTRVVGDFTKSVRIVPIIEEMIRLLSTDERKNEWHREFDGVLEGSFDHIHLSLKHLKPKEWVRKYLQTRFFETGDNFYLGMEFPREYDRWKNDASRGSTSDGRTMRKISASIDRLWYEAAFEVISRGDVYNPSGLTFIPKVYLIDVKLEALELHTLKVGDSFRLAVTDTSNENKDGHEYLKQKYEVLIPGHKKVWVRNIEGILSALDGETKVLRQADLTRSPDGNTESKVAIATFPVAHVVSHRTLNVQKSQHWCTFPIGDNQSSPHFMRYSGLTGAGISSMLVNNYIGAALDHSATSAKDRAFEFSKQTNWSNEEVIHRGTGANFGVDSFLRPGFKYSDFVEYLYYKAVEMDVYSPAAKQTMNPLCDSLDKRIDEMFHRTWLQKFAASLIPREMEVIKPFIMALETILEKTILKRIAVEMSKDGTVRGEREFLAKFEEMYGGGDQSVTVGMEGDGNLMSHTKSRWSKHIEDLLQTNVSSDSPTTSAASTTGSALAPAPTSPAVTIGSAPASATEQIRKYMDRAYIMVDVLRKSYLIALDDKMDGKRISSESENQPRSVDYLVADLPVEAQLFANGLARSSLLATLSLALTAFGNRTELSGGSIGERSIIWFGALLTFTNIFVAFGTMTNISRYQNRNEEFRAEFLKKKLPRFELSLFKLLSKKSTGNRMPLKNPFVNKLMESFEDFKSSATYYDANFEEIENLYDAMDMKSVESVDNFIHHIIAYFIPDVYQKDPYLKDSLWKVCKASEELLDVLKEIEKQANSNVAVESIESILARLPEFTSLIEKTLQTGPIKWGFWRQGRKLSQSVVTSPFRYWLFWLSNKMATGGGCSAFTVTARIKKIHIELYEVNEYVGENHLAREIQDMKELFHASMESAHASTVYFVACLAFTLALFSTALNIILAVVPLEERMNAAGMTVRMLPMWLQLPSAIISEASALASSFASFVAFEYFVKLCYHQRKVVRASNSKQITQSKTIGKLGRIAKFQAYVSLLSAIGALGAVFVLISGVFDRRFRNEPFSYFEREQVLTAAVATVGVWSVAGLGTFYIEFFLLWNFGPTASKDVCEIFKSELFRICDKYSTSIGDEGVIRDYAVRELLVKTRFDSVLGADRFSAIMQTVLSKKFGMETNGNK